MSVTTTVLLQNGNGTPSGMDVDIQLTEKPHKLNKRTEKKKKKKKKKHSNQNNSLNNNNAQVKQEPQDDKTQIEVEYVSARELPAQMEGEFAKQFEDVFKHFIPPEKMFEEIDTEVKDESAVDTTEGGSGNPDENLDTEENNTDKKPTKKERKNLKRLKVAVLKQLVSRPDVVDIHDVNSHDPLLLVFLKSYRNSVPVPKHWSQKRKYLQGKRGVEKTVFQLPENIANTGIAKLRAAYAEKEANKKSKSKQRDRMLPKMHKMDIDYQILHDAFFLRIKLNQNSLVTVIFILKIKNLKLN